MRIISFLLVLSPLWSLAQPMVARIIPPPGSTNHALRSVEVFFDQAVTNVDAGDLLINNVPATDLSFGVPGQFLFEFEQPATGMVQVAWAAGHGIANLELEPFEGGSWSYVLDPFAATAALLLNEFMAENDNTLNDEDGDSEDWIEIHNPGAVEVDIGGWFLTDDAGRLDKWQFPAGKTIPANGYLVVFASNKNRTNLLGQLHTNFQLDNDGEYVALVDRNTNVVSDFPPPFVRQDTDISYGRVQGAPNLKGYFARPTPGAPNQSGGPGFAPEVEFSRPSGTFLTNEPFALVLSTPLTNAVIHYAFGTNVPGTNSLRYSAPLQINNTTLIRARAFVPGLLPGPVTTRSYVALMNQPGIVGFNSELPVMILHNYGQGAVPVDKSEQYVIVQTFEPEFGRSTLTNRPTHAEFGIFHVRGSSTAVGSGSGKASFFLEVQDDFRNGKEIPLLGLPEESDWVLYAPNNFEPAKFHNPMAMQLARDLGEYASRTKFFEVYLKDDAGNPGPVTTNDYYGLFVLMEKIKRDNNRIDIEPLEREHSQEPEVSGGYVWSIDRAATGEQVINAGNASLNWVEPNGFEIANAARVAQRIYVTNYLNAFNNALNNNATWTNPATGYAAYIDVDSWARRHVHEVVTHNIDSLRLSGYLFKERGKKIEYGPAWDYDRTQGSTDGRDLQPRVFRSRVPDLGTDYFNFNPWWARLFRSPDFWQLWIDKYQDYREGPLSMTNISARIEELAAQVRPAYMRESNRWAFLPRVGNVSAPSPEAFTHNFGATRSYENEVRWKHIWYSNRLDFIDTNLLARPSLDGPAGAVTNGHVVTVSPAAKPGTTLFYTLDGTDPRLPSGGISPAAISSAGPVQLVVTSNMLLFARSWNPAHSNVTGANNPPISSPWSGARRSTFYTHVPDLRITEIMYHPQDPLFEYTNDVNFEYIEVKNIGSTPLNLNRFSIGGGVDFQFGNVTLQPGQAGVIVANQNEFLNRYGPGRLILGQYAGDEWGEKTNVLDNASERLVLRGSAGEPILDFAYSDEWYPITDGFGFSLVVVDETAPTTNWVLKTHWRPSGAVDGSPGENDPAPPEFPLVVVNEVLTHTEPGPPYDSVELHNLSASPADVGGWFLTDNFEQPFKFRIPDGTVIAPGGFVVFDEPQFQLIARPFSFSSLGEEVYVFSADPLSERLTGYYHGFDFGAAANGVSFGRHVISTGTDQYPPQVQTSLGETNAGPLIGPVIVSEIHYHPWDFVANGFTNDNSLDEFIELRNISSTNVALYDVLNPENTWHLNNAVEFRFPKGVVMPAGGHLVLVNFNPTNAAEADAFRGRYGVPGDVPLLGPFEGKLDNSGEPIELRRPDRPQPPGPPDFGLVPSLLVERVRYSDEPPWPTNADGQGYSLQRLAGSYGNDPASWFASPPTAGEEFVPGPAPQITQEPNDVSVYFSHDAVFTVSASGAGLRYEWFFNDYLIRDVAGPTLTIGYVQPEHAGEYRVAVIGPGGITMSRRARLTVLNHSATIVAHPQDAVVALTNSITLRANIAVTAPVTYQWFFNGGEIPGANATNLTITRAEFEDAGEYHLRITDAAASIVTRPATLRVVVPPWFVEYPSDMYVPQCSDVEVQVVVTNIATLPVTYRWRRIGGAGSITNENVFLTSDSVVFTNVLTSNRWEVVTFNEASPLGIRGGFFFVAPLFDADQDGMGDCWEKAYGFDPGNPLDAALDSDGDGMTNLAEHTAGTNPTDANSYLAIELLDASNGPTNVLLRFLAVSNRTYSVQFGNTLTNGWSRLQDVDSRTTNRTVELRDTSPDAAARFYRLVTPKQ